MKETNYMEYPRPHLSLVRTLGGYYRVKLLGRPADSLRDEPVYSEMDIGRGPTKEAALAQARLWFEGIEDKTPDRHNTT